MGPGVHEVPIDLTYLDSLKKTSASPQDEWTMTANNPKRDYLITQHRKTYRDSKAEEVILN